MTLDRYDIHLEGVELELLLEALNDAIAHVAAYTSTAGIRANPVSDYRKLMANIIWQKRRREAETSKTFNHVQSKS